MLSAVRRKVGRLVAEIRASYERDGVRRAAGVTVGKLTQAVVRLAAFAGEFLVDSRHGMRTRGMVINHDSPLAGGRHADSYDYQAISTRGFRLCVESTGVDPAATTFVDLGCGRGRAVLFAADRGFAGVLGVELDPDLVAQARQNVHRRLSRSASLSSPIEIRHGDASDVTLPDGPLLVWLYNPFGPGTLRDVLERLVENHRSAPRPVTMCYFNPVHADVVAEFEALVPAVAGNGWTVHRLA
jgi:SAM-dependent methyltransferase